MPHFHGKENSAECEIVIPLYIESYFSHQVDFLDPFMKVFTVCSVYSHALSNMRLLPYIAYQIVGTLGADEHVYIFKGRIFFSECIY